MCRSAGPLFCCYFVRQAADAAGLAGVSLQVRRQGALLSPLASPAGCWGSRLGNCQQQVGSQCVLLQYSAVHLSRRLLRGQPWQVYLCKGAGFQLFPAINI